MRKQAFEHLIDIGPLIEQRQSLEAGLGDLAEMTAESLGVARCSVMLAAQSDGSEPAPLRVCSHYGNLPEAAYQASVEAESSIAGYVAARAEPIVINDLRHSPLARLARHPLAAENLMSAPISIAGRVIGVINISQPIDNRAFSSQDLELLKVYALFIGKSIHVFQLQKLADSRILQMAELLEQRERDDGAPSGPISPDPSRLARIVAKSFYRELSLAGFGPKAIIAVATEVLGLLNSNLRKHRERIARQGDDT